MKKDFGIQHIPDKELRFLLEVLRGEAEEIIAGSFNADRILKLAFMHRVAGPLYIYARNRPGIFSEEQLALLEKRTKRKASRSLTQLNELIRISRAFSEKGIDYACIKGPQLARMIHGREALKESVDLDLMLINGSQLDTAHRCLTSLGYVKTNLDDYKSRFAKKWFLAGKREVYYYNPENRCQIDLHVRIAANAYLTIGRFADLFADLRDFELEGHSVPILPPEKYLVFLCHHGAMHQFSRLGWLMDIRSFILKLEGTVDYKKAEAIARAMKIEKSFYLTWNLLHSLFGDELSPGLTNGIKEHFSTRFIMKRIQYGWTREPSYLFAIRARMARLLYLMFLNRGLAARMDVFAGMLIRGLLPVFRKKH